MLLEIGWACVFACRYGERMDGASLTVKQEILNNLDITYVNRTHRRAQPAHGQGGTRIQLVRPKHPPQIWIVHQATIIGEHRTNNNNQ